MSERDDESITEEGQLQRSGSKIHYWVTGPDEGPLVACTHGAAMDHRMFNPQIQPLVTAGYRVLTWDIRGHGLSKPIGENFSVTSVADDLQALIDYIDHETVILLGHSFGGYVSQKLTSRSPEYVDTLIVIGAMDITTLPSRLERLRLRLSPYLFKIWPDNNLRNLSRRTRR